MPMTSASVAHIPGAVPRWDSPAAGRTIALFGGGRWGRVHASNLSRILTANDRVLWISGHHRELLNRTIEGLARPHAPRFELWSNEDDALLERPHAAIVVTAPSSHGRVAEVCLDRGVHTFVEKPLALRAGEARKLVDIAERGNLILAVGLHLLSASYLKHFKSLLPRDDIVELFIRWFDPAHEIRHGEEKRGDVATTVAHDVYPHIWSIIRCFDASESQSIGEVTWQRGGIVSFEGRAGKIAVAGQIGRLAAARKRVITLRFKSGTSAVLDFTNEPGMPVVAGIPYAPDPDWGRNPAPVMAEVTDFLRVAVDPELRTNWPHLASSCIDSVAGAAAFASKLAASATEELHSRIRNGTALLSDLETRALIWETVVHPLAERGLSVSALDIAQQQLLIKEVLRLHESFAASADRKDGTLYDQEFIAHLTRLTDRVC